MAYVGNYYDSLIEFLRNLLSGCLKDSSYLKKGILTGILRITKESIFSGLNNVNTFSVMNETFGNQFGLLEDEVKELLKQYDLLEKLDLMRAWYNGYQMGSRRGIYNPWSVLKCIAENGALAPYWVNTSDNMLMKQLITQGEGHLKVDIEELLKGGVVEKTIEEGIVFSDFEKKTDTIWSLLLFSGYVTLDTPGSYGLSCYLRIPNIEVTELYKSMILDWFKTTIQEPKYRMILNSLVTGDIETFSLIFQEFFISSVSVFDVQGEESEKIYHAFVLGMLIGLKDRYELKSNRESGFGRYDVLLCPKNSNDLGIIMEFKKADQAAQLESSADSAIKQIKEKRYSQELIDRGIDRILYLGLAFLGKKVMIKHEFNH
jgi:hypothetical protein